MSTNEQLTALAADLTMKWKSAPISMRKNCALDAAKMILRWTKVEGQEERKAAAFAHASKFLV